MRSSAAETAVCSAQAGCERVAHVEGVGPDRALGVGRGQREGEARVLDLVDHRPGRRRSAAAPHAVALGAGHSTSASWYALLKHGDLLGALGLGRGNGEVQWEPDGDTFDPRAEAADLAAGAVPD